MHMFPGSAAPIQSPFIFGPNTNHLDSVPGLPGPTAPKQTPLPFAHNANLGVWANPPNSGHVLGPMGVFPEASSLSMQLRNTPSPVKKTIGPDRPLPEPPNCIIISGPLFYKHHITVLYGGYKRTTNLYGRPTYQKDPHQQETAAEDAYIYWSTADDKWCVSQKLGARIKDLEYEDTVDNPITIYQQGEFGLEVPRLRGPWLVNLTGIGHRYEANHLLIFESLELPPCAADPARNLGGFLHISVAKFVDHEFPPTSSSLYSEQRIRAGPTPEVNWTPASKMVAGGELKPGTSIFGPTGIVGEPCSTLAGIAPQRAGVLPVFMALAEYPGWIESLFERAPLVSIMGRYSVHLFDVRRKEWHLITVDEYVPTETSKRVPWASSCYLLWHFILEKALAKLCGSYEALLESEQGPLLMALTGTDEGGSRWTCERGWWSRWQFLTNETKRLTSARGVSPDGPPQAAMHRVKTEFPLVFASSRVAGTWRRTPELFETLRELDKENHLVFCYIATAKDERTGVKPLPHPLSHPVGVGLICGHGYTLLQVLHLENPELQLVQLRNPWGPDQQWTGPWSSESEKWSEHPEIRRHHLHPDHVDGGRFWMSWEDFAHFFDRLEVCEIESVHVRRCSHGADRRTSSRSRNLLIPQQRQRRRKGWLDGWFRCCAVEKASR